MNLCRDCKFWGTETETLRSEEFRSCTAIVHDEHSMTSSYWKEDLDLEDEYDRERLKKYEVFCKTNKAATKDGSGYFSALKCMEDFGCVLFQSKT